jgi:hypothetical protein
MPARQTERIFFDFVLFYYDALLFRNVNISPEQQYIYFDKGTGRTMSPRSHVPPHGHPLLKPAAAHSTGLAMESEGMMR